MQEVVKCFDQKKKLKFFIFPIFFFLYINFIPDFFFFEESQRTIKKIINVFSKKKKK